MQGWGLIYDLLLALSAALLLGLIFERFKLSAIIGYLAAGAIVGKGGLALLQKPDEVTVIAEIGVALLLFTIGLEFSWRSLRKMGGKVFVGGGVMVVVCTLFLTSVGLGAGLAWQAAVIIGAAGSLSSTAIVMRVLRQRNDLDSIHGKASLGVLLVQDIAVVPLVLGVTFIASGSREIGPAIGQALWAAAILVLVLVIFVSQIVPRLLHEKIVARNRELPIILAVVTCVGATWAAHELGISPALGAFFAGMLLADSKFSEQMRADVMPLRTLFVTIFFVSVGLLADLGWMIRHLPLVLAVTVLVMAVKTVATYFAMRPFVRGIIETSAVALALSQVGEFSFVLLSIGTDAGMIGSDLFQLVISTIMLSLLVAPVMVANALPWSVFLAKRLVPARKLVASKRAAHRKAMRGHVVTIGYGEAGQATCLAMRDIGCVRMVIDLDPRLVQLAEANGNFAVIGDATSADFLEEVAHIGDARAILVTVSDHTVCRRVVALCKSIAPEVLLVTRSRYHVFSAELDMVGADEVVDEEMLVGEKMGRRVARLFGNEDEKQNFDWDSDVPYA
ncbi:MAG: cation:proton antiporter [Fimbriimonadaceae bacterium]